MQDEIHALRECMKAMASFQGELVRELIAKDALDAHKLAQMAARASAKMTDPEVRMVWTGQVRP